MELVQAFNAELSSLYEVKPPISKAKMSQITKVAIKGIKMYKHIVQSVERFIAKCRPEYKIPGLYVIDSIVRQSRHQFNTDRDVFGPRFIRNFPQTFQNLFLTCPPEDKPKIVRVLNLWQRNNVFSAEIIQPLLDMANPNANLGQLKYEGSPSSNANDNLASKNDPDANLVLHLQQLATQLGVQLKGANNGANPPATGSSSSTEGHNLSQSTVKFNKKLLDFDYGEDDEEEDKGETPTEAEPATNTTLSNSDDANTNPLALSMAQNLLSNPELLQRLQQMQQSINFQQHHDNVQMNPSNAVLGSVSTSSSFISSFQPLDLKAASHEEVDMNIVEASDDTSVVGSHAFSALPINKLYGKAEDDPESYCNNLEPSQQIAFQTRLRESLTDKRGYMESHIASRRSRSRSISPRRSRFSRSHRDKDERPRRSRSRSPWKNVDRRSYKSRSRSPRSRLDRQHERSLSPESKEREKERERRRRGLPPLRKGYLTICSTTLWLGHVPKLVSEADISDTFGEFGTINSIDLIPPRGCAYVCMNRRQDAYRALNQLKNLKLHGSTIKMAWAPGKGMKGKEFKDYWDVDLGSSYIPYDKLLNTEVDIELLEDGGMIDEDTMPESFKEVRRKKQKEPEGKASEPPAALVPLPVVPLPSAQPAQPVFGMSLTPGIMIPNVGLTQNQLPVGISQPSGLMPSIQNNGLNSTPTSLGSAMNINSSNTSSIISSQSNPMVPDTSKTDILSSLPTVSSTGQSLSHLVVPPLSSTSCVTTPSTTQTSLQLRPPVQPMLPPPLGMSSIFQPPPLNIPPPSLMAGQRPPPPMSWLSGPPPTLLPPPPPPPAPTQTIPGLRPSITAAAARVTNEKNQLLGHKLEENRLTPSNSFFSEALPPRLHGDLDDLSGAPRRMQSQNSERGRDRFRPQRVNEDPFAHSLFDIPPFERNMGTPVMPNSPRTPLFPRGLEGMSQRDHLELDRRFGRDWHPQMGSRPLLSAFEDSSRCGRAPPREWNRRDQWNRERGGRMDRGQKNRGSFNRDRGSRDRERDHDRERDRDRERDKDRERDRDRERISRWENSETEKVECTTEDHQVEPNVTHEEKPTDENGPISDFDPAGKFSEVDLPVLGNEPEHAPLPEESDPVETKNELPAEEEPSVT